MNKIIYILIFGTVFLSSCGRKTEETKPFRKDITETVFASGILEAKGTYNLTAQADGYLTEINFEEGDMVTKGKVLAVIDNKESGFNNESATALFQIAQSNTNSNAPALAQAQYSIAIAKQKMEQEALQEQRYKRLWETNSIAKVEYENILLGYKTAKSNYETALENYKKLQQDAQQQLITNKAAKEINVVGLTKNQIGAVVSGKVYKKTKQVGDYVRRGDVIATIGDATQIYAKVNIDESNITKVKVGQKVFIQLNTNKQKTYQGTVKEVLPSFDEATQSFICKIYFDDTLDFTIVNTQLQSNIVVGTVANALLIPRNYIDFGGFVQIKDQKEKTKITTAIVSNEWVQVLNGIDENTVLVTENVAGGTMKTSEQTAAMTGQSTN
jgi:HlyD family secretion protein